MSFQQRGGEWEFVRDKLDEEVNAAVDAAEVFGEGISTTGGRAWHQFSRARAF
jgi:hypothetical protein